MSPARSAAPTGWWRTVLEVPLLVVLAVAIVVVVKAVLVQAFYIPSGSMLPQLQLDDKVVVSRMSYRLHDPHRGDIVVFPLPAHAPCEAPPSHDGSLIRRVARRVGQRLGLAATSDELIKRVIGLPDDTVEGRNGHVYVDGRLLLEPYLPPRTATPPFAPVRVPKGEVWVMGDNRSNSCDSKFFGPIRERTIVGRAFLRWWPLTHIAFL